MYRFETFKDYYDNTHIDGHCRKYTNIVIQSLCSLEYIYLGTVNSIMKNKLQNKISF